MPEELKIVSAAIMTPNNVILTMPRPCRHHNILNNSMVHKICNGNEIQGFLAYSKEFNSIKFLDRLEAATVVNLGDNRKVLFSEDLW
jgi:hypothetical protein